MTSGIPAQSFTSRARQPAAPNPWLPRVALGVLGLLMLANLGGTSLVAFYQVYHQGLIFPGVQVWGVEVGGMTPQQAADALGGQFTYPQDVTITFRDGAEAWSITAQELGVQFDIERTVEAAYAVGRQPDLLRSLRQQATAYREGLNVSPVIIYNQAVAGAYLEEIAARIDRPAIDATVQIDGLTATAQPSQIGRLVDRQATLAALQAQLVMLEEGSVSLTIVETPPGIADATQTAAEINNILSAEVEVYIEEKRPGDPGPWTASRQALAEMIVVERTASPEGDFYTVRLNEGQLSAFLLPLGPDLTREPENARFDFDEATGELLISRESFRGRTLNVPGTIQLMNQMVIEGENRVPLVFDYTEPDVPDSATAQELGIVGLISSATTYFSGSSAPRRANVQEAASRFDGIVIAPRAEFSFNEYLGDVSTDSGFEEALIIYNGRTIEGVGGGVCQVSTTAFQAAFFAGYPITERIPHAYRVSYYEVGEGAGLDATVFSPIVDMKFINDSDSYLLITSEVDLQNSTMTFRFYGTPDGRTVQKDGPYVTNVQPHGPAIYEENPELTQGQVQQVDWAVDGADVEVNRTVYKDGVILYEDTFISRYIPWQDVYQVGPGYLPAGSQASTEAGR